MGNSRQQCAKYKSGFMGGKKYGARAALFGRKINNSKGQLSTVTVLRGIADGQLDAESAVREYNGDCPV